MKAIVCHKYGSPDVFECSEVEKPAPKADEVLVNIHAAAANPWDWHHSRGTPFLIRQSIGLLKPKQKILGTDVAGRVEAVGRYVKQFQPGDEIYGDIGYGGFAEYVSVPEKLLAPKPTSATFEEAAAVPTAALTALQGLRNGGQIQPGQTVLVNGASGGVGTFAVQIAKSFGAEVTGVCSTRNLEMVRSLGADHVIDYTQENFTKNGQQYDLIFDAVANYLVPAYMRALSPNGMCVIVGFSTVVHLFHIVVLGSWISRRGRRKIDMMEVKPNGEDLMFLKELLDVGKIAPVIDRRYPLHEVAEAIRYLETGRARGKVVITME
ncbi:NAD(P)-dependent alcohol dehydrogenase [Chloroflexi bacterium TSY]|nr:NAD(P)-dependent alcohol dehydrogenase [Chloroflexi bacterium TSY]